MTIAQLQNLQAFVNRDLADVIDWGKHVRPDPDHKTTGDHAFIVIKTSFNGYAMSVCSAYIEPPAGAPLPCRSLGTVTFNDNAGDKHIVGPKADATYAEIAKHIHLRELTDALAAARREVAEASTEQMGSARVRLASIAERAKKWGVKVRDGEDVAPSTIIDPPAAHPSPTTETTGITVSIESRSSPDQIIAGAQKNQELLDHLATGADAPWLGCPVIFITNPGEQISGMQEIPGTCVKVISDDRIAMFVTPDHSEPSYRDNLPRRGSLDRDGKVHRFQCWDFNPAYARQLSRLRHCEEAIEKMADEMNAINEAADAIEGNESIFKNLSFRLDEVIAENKTLANRVTELEEAATKPKKKASAKTEDPELV